MAIYNACNKYRWRIKRGKDSLPELNSIFLLYIIIAILTTAKKYITS